MAIVFRTHFETRVVFVSRRFLQFPFQSFICCLVQELPRESVYEVIHWFGKRFRGECRASAACKILCLVFLNCLMQSWRGDSGSSCHRVGVSTGQNGTRLWWLGSVKKNGKPIEWKELHVGAEREVVCEHMQALLTYILQRHWQWQEEPRDAWVPGFKDQTPFVASLHVRTAFDVAKHFT